MTTEIAADYAPDYYSPPNTPTSIESMPLEWIDPSELNPRKRFDPDALQELADSIAQHGLLEALVVRAVYVDNDVEPRYRIIAGERRYRAARMAGLEAVPVRVLPNIDDRKHLELALLENLQRQDLDPLEEAAGYKSLSELGYTQAAIAAAVKRSQPAVNKALALLDLPEDVRELIRTGQLTASHGVGLARFRHLPAVASTLADFAVRGHWSSHDLGQGLPAADRLRELGLARGLGGGQLFNEEVCRTCPFDAYVQDRHWGYCLRPEHYDELKAAAVAARDAKYSTQVDRAKAQLQKAGKTEVEAVRIADLRYDAYERLDRRDVPATCTTACPCRGVGLDYDGSPVSICTQPARLRQLKSQVSREQNKTRRQEEKEQLAALRTQLAGLQEIGPREMAVLVASALSGVSDKRIAEVAAKVLPAVGAFVAGVSYTSLVRTEALEVLAQATPIDQVRLAVEVLLTKSLTDEYSAKTLVQWYALPADLPQHAVARIAKLQAKLERSGDATECAMLKAQIAALQAKGDS